MSKYDLDKFFDEDEKPKSDRQKLKDGDIEDPRKNLKVTQCCRNCKHFWYNNSRGPNRGYCKLPNPEKKVPFKKGGEKYDYEEIEKNWIRTHSTMVCDNWQLHHPSYNIDPVADWIKLPINEDGTLNEDY